MGQSEEAIVVLDECRNDLDADEWTLCLCRTLRIAAEEHAGRASRARSLLQEFRGEQQECEALEVLDAYFDYIDGQLSCAGFQSSITSSMEKARQNGRAGNLTAHDILEYLIDDEISQRCPLPLEGL